jgi:ribosomal protein S7
MQSKATTVEQYLAELPEDRRAAIQTVRQTILDRLPEGYEEAMNWGMITYQMPLDVYPDTYNRKPLMYAALASQKNYMVVYLMAIYMTEETRQAFEKAYKATGKRYDVGKSCVRFRKLDDLPLDVIGEAIASMPMEEFVNRVKQAHSLRKSKR